MAKHYYISFNAVDYSEIYPAGSPVAVMTQWEGTRVWREELEQIKLSRSNNATVFDTLESYFTDKTKFDTEIEIEIYSGTRATGVNYYKGLFSISDSEMDPEHKTFKIKPRVNDDYYDISEKYNIQYDLDKATTILQQERIGYAEDLTPSTSTWTNGGIGTAYSTLLTSAATFILTAVADIGGTSEAYLSLPALGDDDIVVIDVNGWDSGGTAATFNIMEGAGTSRTDEGAKSIATGTSAFTMSQTVQTPRLWMVANPGTITDLDFSLRKIDADNDHDNASELLLDFIESFVTGSSHMHLTAYSSNVVSTFINNDALPTGAPSTITTFMTTNPNGNYASETTDNKMNTALVGLMRHWFDNETISFKLSFKEITDQLRDVLQVYWFIDGDDKLRFEHERYFVKDVDDSTAITVPSPGEVDKRNLKYEKGHIAAIEQFKWPQASNTDFVGNDITYNNFITTVNSVTHSIAHITTDIKYVIDNLDDAQDSGMGLYHCNLLTGITGEDIYEIVISTGVLSAARISNAVFSWANIHPDYWTYSRMAEDAMMNGTAVTMDSSVRFLQQEGVRFFYSTAITGRTKIDAILTNGAPVEIRRDLDTDFVEISIAYDPYKL